MKVGLKLTAFLLLSTVFITTLFYTFESRRQQRHLDGLAHEHNEALQVSFKNLRENDIRMLSATLSVILQDDVIRQLYLNRDREGLYANTASLFERLRNNQGITHFYFIDPDGHVFLRMHHPELRGDLVERHSFLRARNTGSLSWEMELGKTAFALRVVMPYHDGNRVIGYVELAEEVDHFLTLLGNDSHSEIAFVAEKNMLNADDWKSVRQVAGLRNNWNDLDTHLILGNAGYSPRSADCFREEHLQDLEAGLAIFPFIHTENQSFLCSGFELENARGQHIGAVLALMDFTTHITAARRANAVILQMSSILFFTIFFLGLIASRWVTKPVRKIARVCRAVGAGDLSQRLDIKTRDEFGSLARTFNAMVEQRGQAEEAIKRSEEKFRDLFENASDCIFLLDCSGNYRDLNRRAVELFGYSREEFLKMNLLDLIPVEQQARARKAFERLQGGQSYEGFAGRMKTRDGKWVDVETSSSPIVVNGTIQGSRDIVRDISDRRRWEEEQMKREKLESLGLLSGGLAHDFNNLLTGVMGNLSLAMIYVPEDSNKLRQLLREAEKACLKTRNLTQQLLTFSKGGAPVRTAVDLGELIRQSVEFSLHGSRTRSSFDIPTDLWPANVDATQMTQVINNLVINANQAMPDGGTLTVSCENIILPESNRYSLRAGRYVITTLTDTGPGIPEEDVPKVFDPYFTTKPSGSGLGLANVYSIIRRHEGYVTVHSAPGVGTSFHLFLAASDEIPERESDAATVEAGKGRILIMDDEETVCIVASEMLRHVGFEVHCVKDGQEAIEEYRAALEGRNPYQAVILDLTVPGGMGGREAIVELLRLDPDAKAIVSSGYSRDPIMGNFREYGFQGVVAKPYRMQELVQALFKVLPEASRTRRSI